jgi:SAM-dependent methyltransferase
MSSSGSYASTYRKLMRRLRTSVGDNPALRQAVGGEFNAVGKLEYHLLRFLGLADGQLVIDVGCGNGRLAAQLAPFPAIRYIGSDIVAELLARAKRVCRRPDWKFALSDGRPNIPAPDGSADYVCFFSVFTHVLQVDSYRYLRDASRVLRPGGRVVMSFLEFRIPSHWNAFAEAVANADDTVPMNQFIDREAIAQWASHLPFEIEHLWDGDKPHIPIPELIVWDGGQRMKDLGHLGQSVAVLRKRVS